jgi:hypothetical protein
LITDFTYPSATGGTGDTSQVRFGDGRTTPSGGALPYPSTGTYPLTADISNNNWHIRGTVGGYSGMLLYWDSCSVMDASAYRGVSFSISGSIGSKNQLTLGVSTLNQTIAPSWIASHGGSSTTPGLCVPASGTTQSDEQGCTTPTKMITVTPEPVPVVVLWADFQGGSPDAYVRTPNQITQIYWTLPWSGSAADTAYPVDFVLDDLALVP